MIVNRGHFFPNTLKCKMSYQVNINIFETLLSLGLPHEFAKIDVQKLHQYLVKVRKSKTQIYFNSKTVRERQGH